MGFFDRLFKGKEVFADRRNPDMVCEMTLCGQSHILSEFDIAYESGNNAKEYMEAYAVFSEPVNAEVENWIMMSGQERKWDSPILPQQRCYGRRCTVRDKFQ